jgi:hypothetical protein
MKLNSSDAVADRLTFEIEIATFAVADCLDGLRRRQQGN